MSKSFLSSDWYRIAPLKLRLKSHVEIHRQRFRGETWHIVQDDHSGKFHRVTPAGNLIMCLMNGQRNMQSLWETACERFEDEPPTQAEVIKLLSQMHAADLVAGDLPPDFGEMGRRFEKQERQSMLARLRNPLALRFPLLDPDSFLEATVGLVRPLFTVWGFLAWLMLVIAGVVLAIMNWAPLTDNLTDRVLSLENFVLMAVAFPLVKAVHELGHAYAAKVWGGEVHEIGVMFLVLIPVPYVDASSSSAFAEKWRRAVVGAAGIMVELALAALALIFWLNVEPGLATAFAFNVMLIGGVSTLLFNGNPLLRFDGYFVLCDLLEIPNFGSRSSKYFWYLMQKNALGLKDADTPVTARGEAFWFLTYAVTSFLYRIMISIAISLFIASKFFFIGIILAVWALSNVFVFPLWKGLKFLATDARLRGRRWRAATVTVGFLVAMVGLFFLVPIPYSTVAQGVVWLDEAAIVRAGTDGFFVTAKTEQARVGKGTELLRLEDPILKSEVELTKARLDEMRLRLSSVLLIDLVQANFLREQIRHLEGEFASISKRGAALNLKSRRAGLALIPGAGDMIGRLIKKGDVLGYVLDQANLRLRVAVGQDQAELVRNRTRDVQILFQRNLTQALPAKMIRQVPESQAKLPSPALGTDAGGEISLDPTDPEGNRTLQRIFVFEITPRMKVPVRLVGERALVRFDHGPEPAGFRIYRAIRQLFLSQFNV